ncbi:hypothetical protein SAMN05216548_11396 [Faunimonas pinastri]|uniref:UPF0235 protein SAMN05216548_11396 n=1 Tax=Faunimonas pinastri TaxID=1855383 RepID=A0A1H9MGZ7_9HYPH|nr:DUF167 family protein [Faunimonas pinastri]SER22453.1 hypothetical protein SAMN05216548_11396 [Faunimonas pinastri]
MAWDAWEIRPSGLQLSVRLTPRSSRDAIEGVQVLSDGRAVLQARVRAVPEKGAANKSLLALVAERLDVPKGAVSLASGSTSRLKAVLVEGEPAELIARLDRLRLRTE